MRGRVLLIILGLGVGLVAWSYSPAPALACSTTIPATIANSVNIKSPAYQTKVADIVLEGTIVNIEQSKGIIVTVQVNRYYKGSGSIEIKTYGFGFGTDCKPIAYVGESHIFYLKIDATSILNLNYEAYHPLDDPTPTNIAEIIAATGQQPTLPTDVTPTATPVIVTPTITAPTPTPTPSLTTQSETGNSNWLWVGLGIIVILGMIGGILVRRQKRK